MQITTSDHYSLSSSYIVSSVCLQELLIIRTRALVDETFFSAHQITGKKTKNTALVSSPATMVATTTVAMTTVATTTVAVATLTHWCRR